ncbi:hypothetical protein ACPCDX_03265 [Streptomyces koyangensis]|uniref:hypothetical protein n=1 Tax=Streptomyces koyangensis TaxID=188770 RepID=UPI003C2F9DDB
MTAGIRGAHPGAAQQAVEPPALTEAAERWEEGPSRTPARRERDGGQALRVV